MRETEGYHGENEMGIDKGVEEEEQAWLTYSV